MVFLFLRLGLFIVLFEPPEDKVGLGAGYLMTLNKKLDFTHKSQKAAQFIKNFPSPLQSHRLHLRPPFSHFTASLYRNLTFNPNPSKKLL